MRLRGPGGLGLAGGLGLHLSLPSSLGLVTSLSLGGLIGSLGMQLGLSRRPGLLLRLPSGLRLLSLNPGGARFLRLELGLSGRLDLSGLSRGLGLLRRSSGLRLLGL